MSRSSSGERIESFANHGVRDLNLSREEDIIPERGESNIKTSTD
jgi:hypothetical protein